MLCKLVICIHDLATYGDGQLQQTFSQLKPCYNSALWGQMCGTHEKKTAVFPHPTVHEKSS